MIKREGTRSLLVAVVLALMVAWMLAPVLPVLGDHILGDPDTDAVRGMWGLDHVRRSLVPPNALLWSEEVNFPTGVLAVVLPLVSAVLLSPLGFLAGPVIAWNLGVAMMLIAAGLATAWLVRSLGGSWAGGLVAGAAVMSQPMLLHAVADGTAEHVAIWTIPAALAAGLLALRGRSPLAALGAGLLCAAVLLDSPYNAVFAIVPGLATAPVLWRQVRTRGRKRLTWVFALSAGVGGVVVVLLYHNFHIQAAEVTPDLLYRNASDLGVWWHLDWAPRVERDPSLAPTLIPFAVLVGGALLSLLAGRRGLPWLGAGLLMLLFSFGLNNRLGPELSYWMHQPGRVLGGLVMDLNGLVFRLPGFSAIRFPQRWLVPSALALSVGAGLGISRVLGWLGHRAWLSALVSLPLAAGAVWCDTAASRIHLGFPMQALPPARFAQWIADQPGQGAVLLLPQMRPAPTTGRRGDLPVFANLAEGLSSADQQYLQTVHGRPVLSYPSLKTLSPFKVDLTVYRQLRRWDDLTHPVLTGNPIPRAAMDPNETPRRHAIAAYLHAAGLRFIAVDLGCYDDAGVEVLEGDFGDLIASERRFDDGDGVLLLTLTDPPS